jgi:hypothetical protein
MIFELEYLPKFQTRIIKQEFFVFKQLRNYIFRFEFLSHLAFLGTQMMAISGLVD